MVIRSLKSSEAWFLGEMLYLALFVPPGCQPFPKEIVTRHEIDKYIENWGRDEFDAAFVAIEGNIFHGCIWARKFLIDDKGYGFIGPEIPEISMAVKSEYRNRGIGSNLLEAIIGWAVGKKLSALSLSVDVRNPAYNLYVRKGFVQFSSHEESVIMIKHLRADLDHIKV